MLGLAPVSKIVKTWACMNLCRQATSHRKGNLTQNAVTQASVSYLYSVESYGPQKRERKSNCWIKIVACKNGGPSE